MTTMVANLLATDDYNTVVRKFNTLTHAEKFDALNDAEFRGYLRRATRFNGSITAADGRKTEVVEDRGEELRLCGIHLKNNKPVDEAGTFGGATSLFTARLADERAHGPQSVNMLMLHNGKHFRGSVQPWFNRKGERVYRVNWASAADGGNFHHKSVGTVRSAEKTLVRFAKSGEVQVSSDREY